MWPNICHACRCMTRCPRCKITRGSTIGHCKDQFKYYQCFRNWGAGQVMPPGLPSSPSPAGTPYNNVQPGNGESDEALFFEEYSGDEELTYSTRVDEYTIIENAMVKWETGKPLLA